MSINFKAGFLSVAVVLSAATAGAVDNTLKIQVDKPGAEISPTMYGLFFEDINYAADGGLYAEMVKNRSFEFPDHLMGWSAFGKFELKDDGPFERNPYYVTLNPTGHRDKYSGLENEGFFGVTVKKDENYRFSVWARSSSGKDVKIRVEIVDPASMKESVVLAHQEITVNSSEWKKYTCVLTPNESVNDGRLRVFLWHPETGSVDLEHISLFPQKTWNGHENGLRQDLAQALYDIKPGVFRFPGGCIVEGTEEPDRYQWKNSVGPVENRPLNLNRWQFTFPYRFYPDYYQSYGLGFYEYFLLSEEIGAEPLPVLNVGMVCQYQNGNPKSHTPVDSLDCYIDDAVDLIEFANGDTTTVWGRLRGQMGHPAPFNLKYLAIGNEQWGPEYVERLEPFVKVLREKHPEIKIVGSSGPSPSGDKFDYLWPEMKRLDVDLVDEHYYANEEWFKKNATRYDAYDRKGPKVFAGEYASHGKGKKYNHFYTSLLEAAFMTGLERNADIVEMATYAPLFAHKKGWQWRPDMIWFDNSNRYLTTSYQVQKLYSTNKGTAVLPITMDGKIVAGLDGQDGLYASAVFDSDKKEYIVKVANISGNDRNLNLDLEGMSKKAKVTEILTSLLSGNDPDADQYVLAESSLKGASLAERLKIGKNSVTCEVTLPKLSFAVYRFKVSEK